MTQIRLGVFSFAVAGQSMCRGERADLERMEIGCNQGALYEIYK